MRTFDTTTPGLLALSAWLAESGCTHIAMEATGVYWRPVWHILADGEFTLILANAAHVKNVPLRPPCGRLLRSRIARGDAARPTWLMPFRWRTCWRTA